VDPEEKKEEGGKGSHWGEEDLSNMESRPHKEAEKGGNQTVPKNFNKKNLGLANQRDEILIAKLKGQGLLKSATGVE